MNEIILAAHIYLSSTINKDCKQSQLMELNGCIYMSTHDIYINANLPLNSQYWTLWHEMGHNIMQPRWKVPVNLFYDEEERADVFAWWIKGKKDKKNYVSKDENRYFSEKCDKSCVKTILNLKLQ